MSSGPILGPSFGRCLEGLFLYRRPPQCQVTVFNCVSAQWFLQIGIASNPIGSRTSHWHLSVPRADPAKSDEPRSHKWRGGLPEAARKGNKASPDTHEPRQQVPAHIHHGLHKVGYVGAPRSPHGKNWRFCSPSSPLSPSCGVGLCHVTHCLRDIAKPLFETFACIEPS